MHNNESNLSAAQILRLKAEEKLDQILNKLDNPPNEPEITRLMHELEVHQIELEMQNDELRLANETSEAALKKYTMLYDFAPMGYFTLDALGTICDLNFTGAEMLGDRRFSLVNSNFKLYVSKESQEVFESFLKNVNKGNSKESCELKLGYNGYISTNVYIEGIVTGDDRKCLLSVVNTSGFKDQKNL